MISVTAVRSFSYFALSFRSVISFLINDNLVNIREKIFFAYSRVSNRREGGKNGDAGKFWSKKQTGRVQ